MIPEDLYRKIVSVLPILCVDVVIRNKKGMCLLMRRRNEPLEGEWWVPGGRVLLGESILNACRRKLSEEVGIGLGEHEFLGFYEDKFDTNSFGERKMYHTLSLVFQIHISNEEEMEIKLDSQHTEWGWFDNLPERLLIS
jgi:colanic acid biosynthesis protein WcaH